MAEHGDGGVVFVSYSRADAESRRRFVEMLRPVVRERRLEVRSDERNLVGEEWRPQLEEAIGRSRAALLLVSPSFLASDFIVLRELPALIEREVRLVCVLVRPCLWARGADALILAGTEARPQTPVVRYDAASRRGMIDRCL
jgi:TIR domain-containing protein